MNHIAEEINDVLMHYGMPRRSGRYPWGSGEHPYQHTGDFLSRIKELKLQGMSETDIAKSMGLKTTEFRIQKRMALKEDRAERVAIAESYRAKGYSLNKIAQLMGYTNDSSVRSLLDQHTKDRQRASENTAEFLKDRVKSVGMLDVSSGSEYSDALKGVSKDMLDEAVYMLQMEGYEVYKRRVPQLTNPGKYTTVKVLCPPGTEYKAIYEDTANIHSLDDYTSQDGGKTFKPKFVYPESMDSKRLEIRYGDQGGTERDGLVEIRRGVQDLDLGNSHYAQVRILVDGTHYIKGMAVYADDLPDGVDVRFNTNKNSDKSKMEVLKKISDNPENPFGSLIKENGGQSYYTDKDGKEKLSLINKRAEEGDWGDWTNKLPSQFLAKQSEKLISKQLELSKANKQAEFDEIDALENGTVKRRLMQSFADDCDAAAVHLKAASLPRQSYQVIIPIPSLKDSEVYAPNYRDGEEVALIRYPHGGTFEIPLLKVNNKNKEASKYITKDALDAVGINAKVAERLSGADFDGDTVMVIPTKGVNGKHGIVSTPALKELKDFDPKMAYPKTDGMKYMRDPVTKKDRTQLEMGVISNLITDMTLRGAPASDIAAAVRHSMVVIDAGKHELNYKQSEKDNRVSALKKKWQGHVDEDGKYHEGASTLISAAKGQKSVLKRHGDPRTNLKDKPWYDPEKPEGSKIYVEVKQNKKGESWYDPKKAEGEKIYLKPQPETYVDKKTGKTKVRMTKSTKMAETDDAYSLSSGTKAEKLYADYANFMKDLANKTRLAYTNTPKMKYDSEARKQYKKEYESINAKLILAKKNRPKERQAQLIGNSRMDAILKEYPDMTKKEQKKQRQIEQQKARDQIGVKRQPIIFTDDEWKAVQAGAITSSMLDEIMQYADLDKLKERATPKNRTRVTSGTASRIKAMRLNGYTMAEIADAVGLSKSTVSDVLNDKKEGE